MITIGELSSSMFCDFQTVTAGNEEKKQDEDSFIITAESVYLSVCLSVCLLTSLLAYVEKLGCACDQAATEADMFSDGEGVRELAVGVTGRDPELAA